MVQSIKLGDKYLNNKSNIIWTVESLMFECIVHGKNGQLRDWSEIDTITKLSSKEVAEMEFGLKERNFNKTNNTDNKNKETAKLPTLSKLSINDSFFDNSNGKIVSQDESAGFTDYSDELWAE